jgi:polyphenol oxidase
MGAQPASAAGMPGLTGPGMRRTDLCDGVSALITARHGGTSADRFGALNLSYSVGDDPAAVEANRGYVLAAAARDGPGPARLAWLRQVHGAAVVHVTDPPPEPSPEADAVFTESPALALAILVADCAPVLLADPVARLVGAAHAGRAGLAAGVVPALVSAMAQAGADPAGMYALIGPAVCGRCYEVPAQMRDEVAALVPGSACVTRKGTPSIDVRAGLHGQLADAGVTLITDDRRCTIETADLYSYRREGTTGRFAGLIWLTA